MSLTNLLMFAWLVNPARDEDTIGENFIGSIRQMRVERAVCLEHNNAVGIRDKDPSGKGSYMYWSTYIYYMIM